MYLVSHGIVGAEVLLCEVALLRFSIDSIVGIGPEAIFRTVGFGTGFVGKIGRAHV